MKKFTVVLMVTHNNFTTKVTITASSQAAADYTAEAMTRQYERIGATVEKVAA